jgi:transmembrane sensor
LALATAAAVAFTIARPPATRDAPGLVERRPAIQTLPDGSKVVVRPGSEIAVAFSAQQRAITLTRGEALFTVAPDPGRPFVVQAGTAQVRAVGTEFAVRRETRGVDVLVTHGRIAVTMESERTAPVEPPVFAEAGHRVVADHAAPRPRVEPVDSATLARALRWRGARIEFSGTPLVEALATFNRESGYALHLADPALGQRAITGVLWTDDADGFVRLLEQGFDLVAERDGERLRLRAK